jgi:copper chaperone CopZ
VKQALSGLNGVESVHDEWDRDPDALELEDLLFVTYDPDKISREELIETIRKQGFEPEIR